MCNQTNQLTLEVLARLVSSRSVSEYVKTPDTPGAFAFLPLDAVVNKPALISAAVQGDVEEIGRLIDDGADVEETFLNGQTALMVATKNGHDGAVAKLLEAGAKINAEDGNGLTALNWACMTYPQNEVVVLRLLDHGADRSSAAYGYGMGSAVSNLLRDVHEGLILPKEQPEKLADLRAIASKIPQDILPSILSYLRLEISI